MNTQKLESRRAGINIEVKNIITNEIKSYQSIRAAAIDLNLAHSTIRIYMVMQIPYNNQYVFSKTIKV